MFKIRFSQCTFSRTAPIETCTFLTLQKTIVRDTAITVVQLIFLDGRNSISHLNSVRFFLSACNMNNASMKMQL